MNLIKFTFYLALISASLGEFGKFPFGSSTGAIYLTDIFLILNIMFFIIWKICTRTKIHFPKSFLFLSLFWLVGGLSLLFSMRIFSLSAIFPGGLYLLRFILYSAVFVVIANLYKSGVLKVASLFSMIIRVGFVIASLGFLQLIFFPNLDDPTIFLTNFGYDPHQGRLTSTFLDPNFAGSYLVVVLGLTLAKLIKNIRSKSLVFLVVYFLIAVLLTYSRSAYLMLGVSAVVLFSFTWKKISRRVRVFVLVGSLVLSMLFLLAFPRLTQRLTGALAVDKSANERLISWDHGLSVFKTSPLLGIGFNNIRVAYANLELFKVYSPDGGHAGNGIDSSFLLILATTGIVGFSIFLIFLGNTLKCAWRNKNITNLVIISLMCGLFVDSQFINSLFFPPLMLLIYSLLGVVESYTTND